jgi:hypothetical protein
MTTSKPNKAFISNLKPVPKQEIGITDKLNHLSSTFMTIFSPMEAKTFSEKANTIMLTIVELKENSVSRK